MLGIVPATFISDEDHAMALAMKSVWTQCIHMLCVWHLSENFLKNLRPLFVGRERDWHEAVDLFWSMILYTDSDDTFVGGTFEFLRKLVLASPLLQGENISKAALNHKRWFINLEQRIYQWAGTYRWANNTFGMSSTQRAESLNAAVKKFLKSKTLLTALVTYLDDYAESVEFRANFSSVRRSRRQEQQQELDPVVKASQPMLSPYAILMLKMQA